MAASINGLAATFAMEDQDCKRVNIQHNNRECSMTKVTMGNGVFCLFKNCDLQMHMYVRMKYMYG